MSQIHKNVSVIDTECDNWSESGSDFLDAFTKFIDVAPTKFDGYLQILKVHWIETKLGPMIAISDDEGLYLLEFADRKNLGRKIKGLGLKTGIIRGVTPHTESIESELKAYFDGVLTEFKTPLHLSGSPFQKIVWEELMSIPYGETRSYAEQAEAIGRPTSYRAVANANGANKLAIIIPCHRIINSNGELGGYGGGVARKKWVIEHEKKYAVNKRL